MVLPTDAPASAPAQTDDPCSRSVGVRAIINPLRARRAVETRHFSGAVRELSVLPVGERRAELEHASDAPSPEVAASRFGEVTKPRDAWLLLLVLPGGGWPLGPAAPLQAFRPAR